MPAAPPVVAVRESTAPVFDFVTRSVPEFVTIAELIALASVAAVALYANIVPDVVPFELGVFDTVTTDGECAVVETASVVPDPTQDWVAKRFTVWLPLVYVALAREFALKWLKHALGAF